MNSTRQKLLRSILVGLFLTVCLATSWHLLKWYRRQKTSQLSSTHKLVPYEGWKIKRSNKNVYEAPIENSAQEIVKLGSILKRMEETSEHFQTFAADIKTTRYTAILETFDSPENGKFFYKRAVNGSALIRWEIADPAEKILTIQNDEALLYQPSIKSAQKFRLGKDKDKAEYLALGIGQSPTDLKKTFNITYLGSEDLYGDACSVLELRPKNPRAAAMFSSISVWIKDSTGVTTRMKLEESYQDYLLVSFSNEQLNRPIDDSKFRQNLPDNVDMLQIK